MREEIVAAGDGEGTDMAIRAPIRQAPDGACLSQPPVGSHHHRPRRSRAPGRSPHSLLTSTPELVLSCADYVDLRQRKQPQTSARLMGRLQGLCPPGHPATVCRQHKGSVEEGLQGTRQGSFSRGRRRRWRRRTARRQLPPPETREAALRAPRRPNARTTPHARLHIALVPMACYS